MKHFEYLFKNKINNVTYKVNVYWHKNWLGPYTFSWAPGKKILGAQLAPGEKMLSVFPELM